jgi:hypothetical protein
MSGAHAAAPRDGAGSYDGLHDRAGRIVPRASRRAIKPETSFYVERALLLWPRLERARIRRFADDPARIAEIVERRTSQPYDVILAMLTRHSPTLAVALEERPRLERARPEAPRIGLRIVRSDEGSSIDSSDLVHA